MREWPVPKRWTRPSAAIASAHHWLAVSMLAPWVAAILSRTSSAAASQRNAGALVAAGGSVAKLVGVGVAASRRRRWLAIQPRLACLEVVENRLGRGRPDARDAQRHNRQQRVECADAAGGLDLH